MKFLVRVLVFCWYLIHFNSKFSPWTIVSKGKIWPRWWSKIQLDQIVRSKGKFFYHTQLGILVLIAIKGVLNVMTLWSTIRSCCIYLLPFFGFEICNSHFFFFFGGILACVLTHESRPDKIQYWHQWPRNKANIFQFHSSNGFNLLLYGAMTWFNVGM